MSSAESFTQSAKRYCNNGKDPISSLAERPKDARWP